MADGYRRLAAAIVLQAVKDYEEAVDKLKEDKWDFSAKHRKQEIEQFFRGDWFGALCDMDGEQALLKLKARTYGRKKNSDTVDTAMVLQARVPKTRICAARKTVRW